MRLLWNRPHSRERDILSSTMAGCFRIRCPMDSPLRQIRFLMEIFGRRDSTLRQIETDEQALAWTPATGKEYDAFMSLISINNRTALKRGYASTTSINPHADRFRRILEHATGDSLPTGET